MWGKIYQHTLRLNDDGTVSPPEVPGIGVEPELRGAGAVPGRVSAEC